MCPTWSAFAKGWRYADAAASPLADAACAVAGVLRGAVSVERGDSLQRGPGLAGGEAPGRLEAGHDPAIDWVGKQVDGLLRRGRGETSDFPDLVHGQVEIEVWIHGHGTTVHLLRGRPRLSAIAVGPRRPSSALSGS